MLRVMVVAAGVAAAVHVGLALAQDEAAPEQEPQQAEATPEQSEEGLGSLFAQDEQPEPAADPAADPAAPPLPTIPVDAEVASEPALEFDALTVTAQKRVQSIVDVPINVTAVGRDDVRNVRIEQVRDLAGYVSNLDIKEQVPGAIPVVSIRGVGLDDFSSTNSPAAGIYVDQITLSSLALMSFDLFDVERIEVLKGPQGTLYGRNSTAGAINVLSASPEPARQAYVKAGYGSYKTTDLEGMYNQPLGETLSLRIAGKMIQQDEGYWESRNGENEAYAAPSSNYTSADPVVRRIGLRDVRAGRARLAWQASETLNVDFRYEQLRQRSEMGQPEMFGTAARTSGSGTCEPIDPENCSDGLQYSDDDYDPYVGHYRGEFPYDLDQDSQTLLVDWDLGFATLSSVSGRIDFERFFHIDVDATPADEFDFFQADTVEQLTQELRLAGSAGLGDWLVGAFYGTDTIVINTDGRHGDLLPGETSHIDADQDTKSGALFGNMDWKLGAWLESLEKFTVTTGLRYTDETRDYVGGTDWAYEICPAPGQPCVLEDTFEDSSITDKNWSWKLGLNWKPTSAQLVYANASKGVKSGGYFAGVTNAEYQLDPYQPEELLGYEAGYKLAGTLGVNASVFYYDYRDKQTFMRANGAAAQYIGNVDKAWTKGADVDVTWRAIDGLTLTGGVGVLRTWLGSFIGPVDADMDNQGDPVPAGNKLPNSPELTWLAKARYELPIGGYLAALQADAHYSDETYKEATNDPLIKAGEYTTVNGRFAFLPAERTWEIAVWGRNLTDERYVVQGLDIATFFLGNRNYNAPRTIGAEVLWTFQ
jgi:iron complex outermembrane receptor protein